MTNENTNRLTGMLNDKDFVDEVLKSKKSLAEILESNPDFKDELAGNNQLSELVTAFSNALQYVSNKNIRLGNPIIGEQSKSRADEFALSMLPHIKEAAEEGVTTTRGLADRFNDLEIKSARGHEWTHSTIHQLKTRLRELKQLDKGNKSDEFAINMGTHLRKLEEEEITNPNAIATRLNELGVKTRRGNQWHGNTVSNLLSKRESLGLNAMDNQLNLEIPSMD